MDRDAIFEIMKWTVIVVITGFLAQFGRKFAEYLISRFSEKNGPGNRTENTASSLRTDADAAKLEKKRLKAEIKSEKK